MEPASFNWNHIIVGLRRVKWLQICFLSLLLGMYFCMMSLKSATGGCSVTKVPTAWLGIKPEQLKLNVLMEERLKQLQNPGDCSRAKKILCRLTQDGCGFGCQVWSFKCFCFFTNLSFEFRSLVCPFIFADNFF